MLPRSGSSNPGNCAGPVELAGRRSTKHACRLNREEAHDRTAEGALLAASARWRVDKRAEADIDRVFAALSEAWQVQMPLGKMFWSPRFGMLTDRFGVAWMVGVAE